MPRNALIDRLERHLPLSPDERQALNDATRRERTVSAGSMLFVQGGPVDTLYVAQHGWLHGSVALPNGTRQIVRFHYAGDLIGTSSIAWSRAADTVTAVSDCVVAELSKPELGRLFRAQPRLAGLLYAMTAAEFVAMGDRLASLGRTDARDRVTVLLLDILARLRVTAGGVVDWLDLPLTQADIGDATGLTKVHVNRVIQAMAADGLIERDGRRIRFVDERARIAEVGFVDRYAVIETEWLPAPPSGGC